MSTAKKSTDQRSSRLQKNAPASIQVKPASSYASDWKVAIPLLSPVVLSPVSPSPSKQGTDEISSSLLSRDSRQQDGKIEKVNFKLWQHPSSPFHYEPTPFVHSFVPRCR
ncbi:hypothetical protein ACHQM5_014361 [Ranunculus cassubicifolius]